MKKNKLSNKIINYLRCMIEYGKQIDPSKPDIIRTNFEFASELGKILRKELLNYKLAERKTVMIKKKKRPSKLCNSNKNTNNKKKIKII